MRRAASQETCHLTFLEPDGVFREDMMADDLHFRSGGQAMCFPTLSKGKAEHDRHP